MTNSYYLPSIIFFTDADKHGPAWGVIPVFMPLNPLQSILLVLSQFKIDYLFIF